MHAVGERHSRQGAWQEPRWRPQIPGRFWKQRAEGVQLEHLNTGAGKDEAEEGAGGDRIGKGQDILLRQRSYEGCHDQMHFTDVLSGHCVEGNEKTYKGLAWWRAGCPRGWSGVNRTLPRWLRRACNKDNRGKIQTASR